MNRTGEFKRQAQRLIQSGYPEIAGLTPAQFSKRLEPLKRTIQDLSMPDLDIERGRLPFVIVVTSELVPTDRAMTLAEKDGNPGVTKLFPHQPKDFDPIEFVTVPDAAMYLLVDIDRGQHTLNLPPNEAMKLILSDNRSPLTIDEGVAIITQFPDFLFKNNCFSLLGSRHAGDKRVPAIWINAAKCPHLGWCWAGNPHTWLGSASCRDRIGA